MKLVIGNKNYSSWSMRPWLLLTHFNVPFEEHRIALFKQGFKQQITDFSQAGKVPVLVDDDLTVWDSLAICEYVSEQYLDGKGYPEDPKARALARAVASEMHAGFMAIREEMPMNCRESGLIVPMNDSLEQDIGRVDAMWKELRSQYKQQGPWLLGQLSIADCMYAPMALRFRTYGVNLSAEATEYLNTLLSWDAVNVWVEQSTQESEVITFTADGVTSTDR